MSYSGKNKKRPVTLYLKSYKFGPPTSSAINSAVERHPVYDNNVASYSDFLQENSALL